MDDEQYINIEDGLSGGNQMFTGKIELSVGVTKIANKNEIFTEEEFDYIEDKVSELDERVDVVENEVNELKEGNIDLTNYVTKSEFEKLTLGYHTDGKIYLFNDKTTLGNGIEMGMNGDIIGYIDGANNIILSGALANDTYTVKYEMEDGTYVDIGSLSLGSTPGQPGQPGQPEEPEEPIEIINQIPLSIGSDGKPFNGGQGWKTGYRLSGSSGNESAQSDIEVTGFIPCRMGDTIYMKGITDDGTHVMGVYDSSFTTVATVTIKEKLTLDGSVTSVTINSAFSGNKDETNTAYFRISADTIDNNSIITVNQRLT